MLRQAPSIWPGLLNMVLRRQGIILEKIQGTVKVSSGLADIRILTDIGV